MWCPQLSMGVSTFTSKSYTKKVWFNMDAHIKIGNVGMLHMKHIMEQVNSSHLNNSFQTIIEYYNVCFWDKWQLSNIVYSQLWRRRYLDYWTMPLGTVLEHAAAATRSIRGSAIFHVVNNRTILFLFDSKYKRSRNTSLVKIPVYDLRTVVKSANR